ncbi:MAG: hypothetical protein ABIH21_00520 [Patescibacteria group bacterium]
MKFAKKTKKKSDPVMTIIMLLFFIGIAVSNGLEESNLSKLIPAVFIILILIAVFAIKQMKKRGMLEKSEGGLSVLFSGMNKNKTIQSDTDHVEPAVDQVGHEQVGYVKERSTGDESDDGGQVVRILVFVLVILLVAGYFVYTRYSDDILKFITEQNTQEQVNNFDDCVKAGNPVMESYPRQCSSGGEKFVEKIR